MNHFRYEVQHLYLKVAICHSVVIMMVIHSRWQKLVSTVILMTFHLHDISLLYGTLPSVWSTAMLGCPYCFQRHSQICRNTGTFYNPAFPLALRGLRKKPKPSIFPSHKITLHYFHRKTILHMFPI